MIENAIKAQVEYEGAIREGTKIFNKTLAETGKQDWDAFESIVGPKRAEFHEAMESLNTSEKRLKE